MPATEQIMHALDQLFVSLNANRLTAIPHDEWLRIWIPRQEEHRRDALAKSLKKSYRFLGLKIDVLNPPKSGAA
jgi:hypothetical protein